MEPDLIMITYIAVAYLLLLVAIALLIRHRADVHFLQVKYRKFLLVPWRVMTFVIALTGIVVIAPYTGDPTWDYIDASFMAILTYLTAPWAVGLLYIEINARKITYQSYIAICLWMFSASWSYDLYLLIRDGYYPITWWSNILASSVLYVSAGLFWSLEHRQGRGVTFNFMEPVWFTDEPQDFKQLVLYGAPFMILVSLSILGFVFDWY